MPTARSVSVAMCTFNGERFIREQLDSIARQTMLPLELVIGDDGSSDTTLSIISQFASSAPFPVRILDHERHLGIAGNFMRTIRESRSDLVVLSDQDDVWLPERLALFLTAANFFSSAKLILSDGYLTDQQLKPLNQKLLSAYRLTKKEKQWINSGKAARALARHPFATGAGMMVDREWAASLPDPVAGILHDEWMAWFAGSLMRIMEEPTFYYRQHADQQTGIDGRIGTQFMRLIHPNAGKTITIEQGIERFSAMLAALRERDLIETDSTTEVLSEKVRFFTLRSKLPDHALKRITTILAVTGLKNYFSYASGMRTILKDILDGKRL